MNMNNLTSKDARKRIEEIDKEFDRIKKKAHHYKNLKTQRQELQTLLETRERNKKLQQAKKRQTEIMKQGNKQLHKIYNAQQTVIDALQKLEPLKWALWNLQEQYHKLRFMTFTIPTAIKKFAAPHAVPKEWAKP